MSLYDIPCVLFAGGKSSRMGKDKALLPFADKDSLAHYQYDRLEKIFSRVYISTKDERKFNGLDAKFIKDYIGKEIYAPTAGFVNAFDQLKTDKYIFVLSVDTPFVSETVIRKFMQMPNGAYDAFIARTKTGIHPLCGLYSRTLENAFVRMLEADEHKLGKLLKNSNVCYIDIEDEDAMLNLNTPEEYKKALSKLSQ